MTVPDDNAAQRLAALYLRISDDPEGRMAGVERQEKECRALAKQLGWTVVAVHRDNDISAYSGKPRPGFRALLKDLDEGRADALIAWHSDRLYRRLPDLEELTKIVQARGVAIRTVIAGTVDLNSASGVMQAEILAAVSKHEVAHSIERIMAAKNEAASKGLYRGGPRPFGYDKDGVTVRESEARWVRHATDAVINGETLRSICRTLAEAGVRTVERKYRRPDGTKGDPESREWLPSELRKLLLRPRNAGLLEAKGKILGPAMWPAVVDEAAWRTCVDILRHPERRTSPGNSRRWIGGGLFLCGECGEMLRATSTGSNGRWRREGQAKPHRPAYKCEHSHVVRDAVQVDEYITGLVLERLSHPDAMRLLTPPQPEQIPLETLATNANGLRAKLDGLADDYGQDLITRKQFLDATAATRARLDEVIKTMTERSAGSVLASLPLGTPEMEEIWPALHLDRKRSIVDGLMVVTVHRSQRGRPAGFKPGTGATYFDRSKIQIDWKQPD